MTTRTPPHSRRDMLSMIGKVAGGLALYQTMPSLALAADAPAPAPAAGQRPLTIELPTEQNVAPYGTMLGKPFPTAEGAIGFRTPTVASWRQMLFDAGMGGEVEIVWVDYRNADLTVDRLEQHHLTQQAVVPLTGDILQVVALSGADGNPDLSTARAFRLTPGVGICMGRDVWHSTRSKGSTCLMLTRGSTSIDILNARKGNPLTETKLFKVAPLLLVEGSGKPAA